MPAAQQAYYNFVAASQTVVTTAESVVATTKPVASSYPGCVFAVEFVLDFVTGAATTALTWRIRRDSLTGTLVLTSAVIPATASAPTPRVVVAATDSLPGEVAGQVYVLTVQATAATGNGAAPNAFSKVTVAE